MFDEEWGWAIGRHIPLGGDTASDSVVAHSEFNHSDRLVYGGSIVTSDRIVHGAATIRSDQVREHIGQLDDHNEAPSEVFNKSKKALRRRDAFVANVMTDLFESPAVTANTMATSKMLTRDDSQPHLQQLKANAKLCAESLIREYDHFDGRQGNGHLPLQEQLVRDYLCLRIRRFVADMTEVSTAMEQDILDERMAQKLLDIGAALELYKCPILASNPLLEAPVLRRQRSLDALELSHSPKSPHLSVLAVYLNRLDNMVLPDLPNA